MRQETVEYIMGISKEANAFDQIEHRYLNITREEVIQHIKHVGILPERFDHDSSEEKLWSKFSDVILATALNHLGLSSRVIRTRGNAADVFSFASDYTMVGDAKCFRLSRTAKNQKDFKIKALDDWRRQNTFALLVAPIYQFPLDRSQIYSQAITKNVTLLSYTHLHCLLACQPQTTLRPLWEVGHLLSQQNIPPYGRNYWNTIDRVVADLCGMPLASLKPYKDAEVSLIQLLATEGIDYWRDKVEYFQSLSREEAIDLLIKSQKIEQKIQTLHRVITRKYTV